MAHLLGDLVAYRASGTGHLEFLAGFSFVHSYLLYFITKLVFACILSF